MKDHNNYNSAPEGLKEISLREWTDGMFEYCLDPVESRQVKGEEGTYDLRLFPVPNFDNKKLGYAIMRDWFDNQKEKVRDMDITRFCRYGTDEDWKNFKSKFAAQFAGDNS